ncbi:uncharacterized protein LOC126891571 [Diabrotica virgifera virgifera]|uniref:HAT C-terminal dimerisation domain-containing protein n=1 Tax=Diabrotica virgifera virgifera TaxID=50390 RepID=A0ABM5L2P9_DIAVI|nr:uncharacterized protein LOC126891571 [Diabrotica virgifera virgifera]
MAKSKGVVGAFIDKLSIFEENIQRGDLTKFPNLKSSCGDSDDLQTYCLVLQALKEDLQSRFQDLTSLKMPTWFIDPLSVEVTKPCPSESLFRECAYERFWPRIKEVYPILWNEIKLLLLAFPATYLGEKCFSSVCILKNKQRNRLDIIERGDLRLLLTYIEPDKIMRASQKLCEGHQAQMRN